jgi:Leucine-rich repeat (LRR) protein
VESPASFHGMPMTFVKQAFSLVHVFPNLKHLELGYNQIQNISLTGLSSFTKLEFLNLDSNQLENWGELMLAASLLPACVTSVMIY